MAFPLQESPWKKNHKKKENKNKIKQKMGRKIGKWPRKRKRGRDLPSLPVFQSSKAWCNSIHGYNSASSKKLLFPPKLNRSPVLDSLYLGEDGRSQWWLEPTLLSRKKFGKWCQITKLWVVWYLSVCLRSVYHRLSLSVSLSVCPSVLLSVCLHLSLSLSLSLSRSLSLFPLQ